VARDAGFDVVAPLRVLPGAASLRRACSSIGVAAGSASVVGSSPSPPTIGRSGVVAAFAASLFGASLMQFCRSSSANGRAAGSRSTDAGAYGGAGATATGAGT
jgi:hypothetical protein